MLYLDIRDVVNLVVYCREGDNSFLDKTLCW